MRLLCRIGWHAWRPWSESSKLVYHHADVNGGGISKIDYLQRTECILCGAQKLRKVPR